MDNAIEKSTAAQYDKLIFEKSGTPSHLLCWGHYYEILKIDDELERNFYIRQCPEVSGYVA